MAGWLIASGRTLGILACSALLLISTTLGQTGRVSPARSIPYSVDEEVSDWKAQPSITPSAAANSAEGGEPPPPAAASSTSEPSFSGTLTSGQPAAALQRGSGVVPPKDQRFQFEKATPVRMAPVWLQISSIQVDARIESVGVTETGEMATPADYWDVGWYRHGARPGDDGRAVIAGHLDSQDGAAVFYDISQLKPGDQIRVLLGGPDGERVFTVRETAQYPAAEAPVEYIFGPSDHPELVLITCDGDFEGSDAGYSDRFVVYADMVVPVQAG